MKTILAAIMAVALAAAFVFPVYAGPSSPLILPTGYPLGGERQSPVEQQSDFPWEPGPTDCSGNEHCVNNPLPCAWDVDDHWQFLVVNRTLAGLSTVSGTVCQVFDADPQWVTRCNIPGVGCLTAWWSSNRARLGMRLTALTPDLVITIRFVQLDRTFTLMPRAEGNRFAYEFCGHAVYNPDDPALGPISGSAGGPNNAEGVGIRTDIQVSVTNPSKRGTRDITMDLQEIGAGSSGASCLRNPTYDEQQHEYPFTWTGA